MKSGREFWCRSLKLFRLIGLRLRDLSSARAAVPARPREYETAGRLFCSNPFTWLEVGGGDNGNEVFLCCPSFLRTSIGNAHLQSIPEIWNSAPAQAIRRSILDGSFRYCDRNACPYLQTMTGPVQLLSEISDRGLRAIIAQGDTFMTTGPRGIGCNYDRSCNLRCPSCRTGIIDESRNQERIRMVQEKILRQGLGDARTLYISGSGEPLASQGFSRWLRTFDSAAAPQLERLHIHTNGLLWTPELWAALSPSLRRLVKTLEISIDAADPRTYALNRPPGRFETLLENLEHIRRLRRRMEIQWLRISMVVQENNFREMPDFILLGKRYAADLVYFLRLDNWGTYSESEYLARAVHLPRHPGHDEFLSLLAAPVFDDPMVDMGNLSCLRG
jgi:hypothetical protein